MESLVCAVVHDNSTLQAHLECLEGNKDLLNVPAAEETAIP